MRRIQDNEYMLIFVMGIVVGALLSMFILR